MRFRFKDRQTGVGRKISPGLVGQLHFNASMRFVWAAFLAGWVPARSPTRIAATALALFLSWDVPAATPLEAGYLEQHAGLDIEMRWIPGGVFSMGSPEEAALYDDDEGPV